MTCLPKGFLVFSPFSFSSCVLYSAYVLLIISSLSLSTLLCVHLCPSLPLSEASFNSSRFLCCSMPSLGVSTTSINTSSSLAIMFIKCRNQYQMKNNTRCKENTNNNSAIIFKTSKTPTDGTLPGRTSSEVFVMLVVVLHFIFGLHFVVHLLMLFILLLFYSLLFDIIPHPSVDYGWDFYTPFSTFSPTHRRVICDTFICSTIPLLSRALRP